MDIPDIEHSCCFTGHREGKLPWHANEADPRCRKLKGQIADAVQRAYDSGVRHYICGMATGGDTYFCEAVIALREQKQDITLEAAIPYAGQSDGWRTAQRARYERLLSNCDYETIISNEYIQGCMQRRNRYMVDASRLVIAAYNGRPGGTMSTLLYAMRNDKEIIEIEI